MNRFGSPLSGPPTKAKCLSLLDAVDEIEISEVVEHIVVCGSFADCFELGDVLKDLLVSLGLFLPLVVVVSRSRILYPLEYLLVILRYSLQFPSAPLLTERVGVLDAVVRAVDPTLELRSKTVSYRVGCTCKRARNLPSLCATFSRAAACSRSLFAQIVLPSKRSSWPLS